MILGELLSLRSSTLPIIQRSGLSSRHTKLQFPPRSNANAAASLLEKATERWGDIAGFKSSPLAECRLARKREGAAA